MLGIFRRIAAFFVPMSWIIIAGLLAASGRMSLAGWRDSLRKNSGVRAYAPRNARKWRQHGSRIMGRDLYTRGKDSRRAAEPERVAIGDSRDMRRWCARLGCTHTQLRVAILAVGLDPDEVEAFATADE